MNKVIGGEFVIENSLLNENNKPHIEYSSGRSAFFHILQNIADKMGKDAIFIPDFLCDSITKTIRDIGWKYAFYRINDRLKFDIEEITNDTFADVVLIINYFGLLDMKDLIVSIKERRPDIIIIEDDVQAYYEYTKSIADYSFTSLRKWFPCPDGAFIKSDIEIESYVKSSSKWNQYKFAGNLLKNYGDYIDDSICLELLAKGENILEKEYLSKCSEVSKEIFSNLNFEEIVNKRKENAKILHENLSVLGINHIYSENAIPLFIPIFIKDRDNIRREFFRNNIFTPIHWPKVSNEINGANVLYDMELSLICDQRYDSKDMMKQIDVLRNFIN